MHKFLKFGYPEKTMYLFFSIWKESIVNSVHFNMVAGVGQVILQVAASGNVKECFGIEKADIPANYAVVRQIHLNYSFFVK